MANTNTKKLPNKFIFSHRGDSSVGINPESVTVEYEGEFVDPEYHAEFVETIRQALENLWDFYTRVTPEHEHECVTCKTVFKHLDDYCEPYCSTECAAKHEELTRFETEEIGSAWDAMLEDHARLGDIDMDKDYFRERNKRTLAGINGAGVRA